jgi:uncharacterized protein (DUF1697 family)
MTSYVALLRGINVGGSNTVPMADLRAMFAAVGFADAQTYIQSGNVVFSANARETALVGQLEAAIAKGFSLQIPVVVRSRAQLAAVLAADPFPDAASNMAHVAFLSDKPSAKAIATLDPERSPPDEFLVAGREVYLHYPNGSGRSRLTADYLERVLGVRATVRNRNTVTKLLTLMG